MAITLMKSVVGVACPPWIDGQKSEPCARALHLATLLMAFAVGLTAIMFANNVFFPIAEAGPDFYRYSVIFTATMFGLSLAAYALMWLRAPSVARPLLLLVALAGVAAYAYMLGQSAGADIIGALCVVFLPALIYSGQEKRARAIALIAVIAATIAIQYWMQMEAGMFTLPAEDLEVLRFNVVLVAVAIGLFVVYLHFSAEKAKAAVAAEKERADGLLLNILPADIAARLKSDRSHLAERHDEVCVLFADLVGFTRMSAGRPAAEIVALLDRMFSRFDALCDEYDVEKIKTLGDGYFAATGMGGRPNVGDPAETLADFALAMRDAALEMGAEFDEPFSIRVGLHLGPAVSGVIGTRKFAFDLWGATVNMASRMESNSVPGVVTISPEYRARIAPAFETRSRGLVTAKGVGEVEVFALLGRKTDAVAVAAQ